MDSPSARRAETAGRASKQSLRALFLLSGLLLLAPAASGVDSAPDDAADADPPARSVGEVTVTATRAERDSLQVPGNVTVIDREEIERSGLRDVPELLRRQPGVYVTNTTTSPEGYGIEIRGFNDGGGGGSSTLVLVDGRRINEPDSSNVDWSWLRLDDVERIEILRGPASAAWGDNAVGGVIQIFTRRGEGATQATLKGRAGSYDNFGGSLYAGGSQGPVTASLYADGLDSDNYRDRADFWSYQVEADARVTLGDGLTIGFGGGRVQDERDRPGALSDAQIAALGRRAANPATEGDILKRKRFHFDGFLEWSPIEEVFFKLVPYYEERHDDGQITVPPSLRFVNDTKTESLGINPQGQVDLPLFGRRNRLVFGADIQRDDIRLDDTSLDTGTGMEAFPPSNKKSRRRVYAGYVQEELEIFDDWIVSGGVRIDSTELNGKDLLDGRTFKLDEDFWSPKAALTWQFLPYASAYFSYAKGFRLPNIDEAFGFFGFAPSLDPARSDSYEIGLKVRRERISFDLALYRLDVKDEILFNHEIDADFGAFGIFPSPRSVNIDRVRHQGIEVSTRIHPWSWFEIYGSYTYEDNEIRRDKFTVPLGEMRVSLEGKRLPITPEHRGSFGVSVTLPYWVEFGFNANVTGSRYGANDLTNEFSKLSAFAVYDTRVAFRPRIGEHLELDFGFLLRNLFDRKYNEFGGERTFVRNEFGFFPSPGRNYMGTLAVTVRR